MMVLFLICLGWSVLLGPLMWWHRELFFGWNTVGANVGGIRKSGWNPRTRERRESGHVQIKYTDAAKGDKASPKDCSSLKSYESFYTCPRAPFNRETRGLLHSENTLELKECS
jgi:hypothetical protein